MKIGGNTMAIMQMKKAIANEIGEDAIEWLEAVNPFRGWLDLSGGESKGINYNAKIQESTHIFVCDYFPLIATSERFEGSEITPENSRLSINQKLYDVMIYDNVMNLNQQLEIYLKYVGGQ